MARRHRDTGAGIFHVYTHCVWAAPALFRDDTDRVSFLRELARATARIEWTCMAYCLMRTHYHVILDVEDGALPRGMHALNFRYACAFNQRHDMRGHVQAARYGSRRVADDEELKYVFRYVARNPVEAGLCADPADWPWSSYAATIGKTEPIPFVDPTRIINCFGDTPEQAIASLRAYVERSTEP
jgi:REP element-mobilizing transposase RayT